MIDPSLELRAIKPAIDIPQPSGWPLWATLALAALAAAAAAAIVWWRWCHRRKRPAAPTPAESALAVLESIHGAEMEAQVYAMAISDILRRFIEQHFRIAATHQTTDEFLQELSSAGTQERSASGHDPAPASPGPGALAATDPAQRCVLAEFLSVCDLAKFARGQLDQPGRQRLQQVARSFILATSKPAASSPGSTPHPGGRLQPQPQF